RRMRSWLPAHARPTSFEAASIMNGRNVIAVLLIPTLLRLDAAGKHQAMCELSSRPSGPEWSSRWRGLHDQVAQRRIGALVDELERAAERKMDDGARPEWDRDAVDPRFAAAFEPDHDLRVALLHVPAD